MDTADILRDAYESALTFFEEHRLPLSLVVELQSLNLGVDSV